LAEKLEKEMEKQQMMKDEIEKAGGIGSDVDLKEKLAKFEAEYEERVLTRNP